MNTPRREREKKKEKEREVLEAEEALHGEREKARQEDMGIRERERDMPLLSEKTSYQHHREGDTIMNEQLQTPQKWAAAAMLELDEAAKLKAIVDDEEDARREHQLEARL